MPIAITKVHGIACVELIVTLNCVLILAISRRSVCVQIIEGDSVSYASRSGRAGNREEVGKERITEDLEVFDAKRI